MPETDLGELAGIERLGRPPMPELEVAERIDNFLEVDLTLSEEEALKEARRCLQCGLTCYWMDAEQATRDKEAA